MADNTNTPITPTGPPPQDYQFYNGSQPTSSTNPPPYFGGPQPWHDGSQLPPAQFGAHIQHQYPTFGHPTFGHPQQGHQPPHQGLPQPGYGPQTGYPAPAWQPGFELEPHSIGYVPGPTPVGYNPGHDAEVISKSLTGALTLDAKPLINLIPRLCPLQLGSIHQFLLSDRRPSVGDMIGKKFPTAFKDAVRAVLLGPLGFDVWLLNRAMEGAGTNETFLNMVLLDRKNSDLEAIKDAYHLRYKANLFDAVMGELSGDIHHLYMLILTTARGSTPPPHDPRGDAQKLYCAMVGAPEGKKVSEILATRSYPHLLSVVEQYKVASSGKTLEESIEKSFGGDIRDALLYILRGVTNRALRDAKLLEGTMKGIGTRDEELNYRVAALHWNKPHMRDVSNAYQSYKGKSLISRIKGETSGDHKKLLVALLNS